MNYLAHAALAQPNQHSLVGNLLGDFCKGVCVDALHPAIKSGLHNHRATDRYTDTHPLIVSQKVLFSPQRRRFAAVAMDVLFDHFLIHHWQQFYPQPFEHYKAQLYAELTEAAPLMPNAMRKTMLRVCQQDWFTSYQQLPMLGLALDHIAQRVRFSNQFSGIIDEISPRYAQLEQCFLQFYPQLQQHLQQLGLETA
ncbi:acyl carrier protein phosphodiesterase [Arsukibacterium sp.]|uniref:acyl carrier protein phosphodiesterase n=1 Tax=Arsukibacterium sp. TaxID=1977258 RepID=UPI002FD946A6